MALRRFFGDPHEHAATVDESGRWSRWVAAQPALGQAGSAVRLVAATRDRARSREANALLLGLVRVGSEDGGADVTAAAFVCALLEPGAERLVRSLRGVGGDVAGVVAGQLWLQVRGYPWRNRPNAVARNVLLDTRRAVLAEYGVQRSDGAVLVTVRPVDPQECPNALDRPVAAADETGEQVADLELLQVLSWARGRRALSPRDARLLWDLTLTGDQPGRPFGAPRSRAEAAMPRVIGDRDGVDARSVRRRRDAAVSALRLVSDTYLQEHCRDGVTEGGLR